MTARSLFERSRRRIVAAIMAVLVALFAITLAAIYAFSYAEVHDRDLRMLEDYALAYQADRLPPGVERTGAQRPRIHDVAPVAAPAPFYAVLFGADGTVMAVENDRPDGYSDDELVALAEDALSTGERSGLEGALLFAVERTPGYTLVAFMDNTLVVESMGTLFRYTLIVGAVVLVVLFFVARSLAGLIVRPMQEAYEEQRRFISDAGHELKTPVAVVEANAELLQRQVGENPWLDNIRYENGRMGVLVTQLLALARSEERSAIRTVLDLSRTVEKEALSNEPLAFEKNMPFTCDVEEGIEVEGDASELARLTAVLLDNAFSHGASGMPVILALSRCGRMARLTVTNGIAPEEAGPLQDAVLFERFARGDDAREQQEEGLGHYGLGLAIARAIAEGHGGTIEAVVDEAALSVTFVVMLPMAR